jgi:hypothetical protein
MAPHNCAGVIARIIGFSKMQGVLAHPYMHAAIRRDCVYPETNFIYSENQEVKSSLIGEFVESLRTSKDIEDFKNRIYNLFS